MAKKKISNDGANNYNILSDLIERENLTGIDVLDILTDYHGLQLLTKDFMENLRDCEDYDLPESD